MAPLLILLLALAASVALDLAMVIDGWIYPASIGLALAASAIYIASRRSRPSHRQE